MVPAIDFESCFAHCKCCLMNKVLNFPREKLNCIDPPVDIMHGFSGTSLKGNFRSDQKRIIGKSQRYRGAVGQLVGFRVMDPDIR